MLGYSNYFSQPWQVFEKTLGRPSEASFAPRQFSPFVALLLRTRSRFNETSGLTLSGRPEAHQKRFGIIDILYISAQGITAKFLYCQGYLQYKK